VAGVETEGRVREGAHEGARSLVSNRSALQQGYLFWLGVRDATMGLRCGRQVDDRYWCVQ
jgi:hypothetical protein